MTVRILLFFFCVALAMSPGCNLSPASKQNSLSPLDLRESALAANQQFMTQRVYDPWALSALSVKGFVPAYVSDGRTAYLVSQNGVAGKKMLAGRYLNGNLQTTRVASSRAAAPGIFKQVLDMRTGQLSTETPEGTIVFSQPGFKPRNWTKLWVNSDVSIVGDSEAQQVMHANLFYLLSSTFPGSDLSIPPMGLSSATYGGHIFWDADIWMFPALIVQHPEDARTIVDYRFRTLNQAIKNAKMHHLPGAEYPWESADTGAEVAPPEFAQERHITADVAFAAWQYYLWTGDKSYLVQKVWPILHATAEYWTGRITKDPNGSCHIRRVLPPDETAGLVDDDTYTNAAVRCNLIAATKAAALVGAQANPKWNALAESLVIPFDKTKSIPAENSTLHNDDNYMAKQADTLLMVHPLGLPFNAVTTGHMLDYYALHTISTGPAMTASIHGVIAARLGRGQESLNYFHDSYRPFMRGPMDAFSEKRTTNNTYFMTGMAGSLQVLFYGFAGLHVCAGNEKGIGTKIAGDKIASLYSDPHLPPGWGRLTLKGVKFRGRKYDVIIDPGNKTTVTVPE